MGVVGGTRVAPEAERLLLEYLVAGVSPWRASALAGVSHGFAYRLHHKMGGVYRPVNTDYSGRYLSREERYEMARLRDAGLPMRQVAQRLGRSAATVSRELKRNAPLGVLIASRPPAPTPHVWRGGALPPSARA